MAILLGISVTTEHSVVPHGIAVIDLVKSLAWLRLNFTCMSNTWTSDERTESIVTDFSVCFLSLHWHFKEFVLDFNADRFHGVLENRGNGFLSSPWLLWFPFTVLQLRSQFSARRNFLVHQLFREATLFPKLSFWFWLVLFHISSKE